MTKTNNNNRTEKEFIEAVAQDDYDKALLVCKRIKGTNDEDLNLKEGLLKILEEKTKQGWFDKSFSQEDLEENTQMEEKELQLIKQLEQLEQLDKESEESEKLIETNTNLLEEKLAKLKSDEESQEHESSKQAEIQNSAREKIDEKILEAVLQRDFKKAVSIVKIIENDPEYKENTLNFIDRINNNGGFDLGAKMHEEVLNSIIEGNFDKAISIVKGIENDLEYQEELLKFIETKDKEGAFDQKPKNKDSEEDSNKNYDPFQAATLWNNEQDEQQKELNTDTNTKQPRETQAYQCEYDPFQATTLWNNEQSKHEEKKSEVKETTPQNDLSKSNNSTPRLR